VFFSNYFGSETEKAVKRYQTTKNIVSSGTPETTGYGQLGPSTRASLNNKEAEVYLDLYPRVADLRDKLKRIMAATGHPITVTDEYRSIKEQDELYAQGRTKPGNIVTNAKGGESFHNFRCAFDIAFTNGKGITYTGPWNMVGEIGKAIGLEWGGDWTSIVDKPHFQLTLGYSLSDFRNGTIDISKFNK
jgi:peptidoglycan hydrolase-like protein with peptidoglycan-binding domain